MEKTNNNIPSAEELAIYIKGGYRERKYQIRTVACGAYGG